MNGHSLFEKEWDFQSDRTTAVLMESKRWDWRRLGLDCNGPHTILWVIFCLFFRLWVSRKCPWVESDQKDDTHGRMRVKEKNKWLKECLGSGCDSSGEREVSPMLRVTAAFQGRIRLRNLFKSIWKLNECEGQNHPGFFLEKLSCQWHHSLKQRIYTEKKFIAGLGGKMELNFVPVRYVVP